MQHFIEENAKVSDFITHTKQWDTDILRNILPNHITNKIKTISFPFSDLKDRLK